MDREPIALGYWRFVTSTLTEKTTWVPDHIGGRRPLTESVPTVCQAEYQEGDGSGTALCECSTFAIGICARCKAPVCGMHSRLTVEGRLCNQHAAEFDEAAKLKAAQRRRQQHEEGQRVLRAGIEYTRSFINAFVDAMAEAGNPGAVSVGGDLYGWPIGQSSSWQVHDTSRLGYTTHTSQRVLTTDGQLGDCTPHFHQAPRKKKWYQRRLEPDMMADLAQPSWLTYTDFRPLGGTPNDENLRIELMVLARQHHVQLAEPAKPDGLRERPTPGRGVVIYYGAAPGMYARLEYDDKTFGTVEVRNSADVQPDSRPLFTGDRVSFDYYSWNGRALARNVRRVQ